MVNIVELRRMAKTVDGSHSGKGEFNTGLRLELLAEKYLKARLPNKSKLARSNWDAPLVGDVLTCA